MSLLNEIEYIPINLASPEKILEWSYGEVTKPETINYRTHKPEKDGLFCERIFGPSKDYQCASWCGTYKKSKDRGKICEKCGVEVTTSKVRRERMGHIELAAPVAHFWFFRSQTYLSTLLNIPFRKLENIIYCKLHLVTDPGDTPLERMQLLTGSEYETYIYKYGNRFKAGIGASVIKELLMELDLDVLASELVEELKTTTTQQKKKKLTKRIKVVESFRRSGNRPEWLVMDYLPVIPPELRPMVQLDGGRFATADLNDLYRRIINRNNRLKKLLTLGAPEIIIENEKCMLQQAVDALIANHRQTHPFVASNRRVLKSLSSGLEGKQGRFRQNLLGKRVDYSGRSVIVVGPDLKLHQCGIPRKMAIELFKPFVINQMVEQGQAPTANAAVKMIDQGVDVVWDILQQVVDHHPVILNRAPTLHKLSVRAFEPVIIEGSAITLHPLACEGFNADFDGDQMAVHVPLSREAQAEARVLMLASENLLRPQNGESATTPSQDMVLGCHYLTIEKAGLTGEGKVYGTEDEAINAYKLGYVDLHARIILYIKGHPKFDQGKYLVTTVGKIIFNQALPQKMVYINEAKIATTELYGLYETIEEANEHPQKKDVKAAGKGFLKTLISYCYDEFGSKATVNMLDNLKTSGFSYATRGGITISLFDIDTPEAKKGIIAEAETEIDQVEYLFDYGRLSDEERYEKVIEIWNKTSEKVADLSMEELNEKTMNPIRMMIDSGARGSKSQYRQLAAMRGLMADPSGRTIERPIKANFKEGLSVFEFFISTHGARKGMADTSLKTADSGYLTRRLVDVSQDVVVTMEDCGTDDFNLVEEIKNWETLEERIVGRFLGEDLFNDQGDLLYEKNTLITEKIGKDIVSFQHQVPVRTLLSCEAERGVCQKCYGVDLSTRKEVEVGEAVGVIAAQSIGEPGTQLTMRTFHLGGVAGDDITQGLPRIQEIFEARKTPKGQAVLSWIEGTVEIVETGRAKDIVVHPVDGEQEAVTYPIASNATVLVKNGEMVVSGQMLTQGSINPHELVQLKGIKEVQKYLIEDVQLVYRKQGVKINDKHIEIIVRQMSRKVRVKEKGDSKLEIGWFVDFFKLKKLNRKLISQGKEPAVYSEHVLGITDASLANESFLSAASFQETAKALTEAAIRGKRDYLKGLKETIITGKRMPAGTGFDAYVNKDRS